MTRKMKIIVGVLVSGIIAGLLMLALGLNGPIYRTEVVALSVNLQSPSEHQAPFTVDRTEEYMVEVHLKSIFSEEKMDKILGDFVEGGGGEIDLLFEVKVDDSVIAHGSNTEYGYSPIWNDHRSGLAIGTVNAERGKVYTLSVFTKNVSTDWNQTEPYVEVGLHPAKLEGYLVLQIFGLLTVAVFGVVLIITVLLHFISKRNMASNKRLQIDAATPRD